MDENVSNYGLENYNIFFCRRDGIPIYAHGPNALDELNNMSIGALIGGVWQAASALTSFIPQAKTDEFFRLSFDTSSKGVYILPMKILDQEFFFGTIFYKEINPGLLKSGLRTLTNKLSEYASNEFCVTKQENNNKTEYLFNDITDAEMDNMFSF